MAEKIIRSHATRVKRAKEMIKTDSSLGSERISIIDREAIVEFLLLEDIVALYQKRLDEEKRYIPRGRADEKGKRLNIQKFSAVIDIFNAAAGSARAAIKSGDYKKVWKAIHEGALMAAANSVKHLPELKKLAIELIRDLSDDTMYAVGVDTEIDEALDDLDAHEENVRRVKGLPSESEIEELIKAIEIAIPDETPARKTKATPKLN